MSSGTLTGALRDQFGYGAAGMLISITDGDNNVTTLERTADVTFEGLAPFFLDPLHRLDDESYVRFATPAGQDEPNGLHRQ